MFKKRREQQYQFALQELTQLQVLQQILLTLERMEALLESIDGATGHHHDCDERVAEATAAWVNRNTEELSKIGLFPDSNPK